MASIELYIDNQLCETENPENFSVYLKRQFLNPAELSTKDAQRSYDITLPATATNNAIFGYTNVEEVKGKFSRLYDAQLLVNGIKIFDGKFKLSEITKTTYKGNLGVPAPKTVKDIFGDMMMNECGEWLIDFSDPARDMTAYNKGEMGEDSHKYFFPLVVYGLLPKIPKADGKYSKKEIFDDTIRFRLNDLPPSINCLEAIKHIFESQYLTIGGTAFDDPRLKNLYMSYKNPEEYIMPWNYGKLGHIQISGKWKNFDHDTGRLEVNKHLDGSDDDPLTWPYTVDLLNASHNDITIIKGSESVGRDIWQKASLDVKKYIIEVPQNGLYKIVLDASIDLTQQPINKYERYEDDWIVSARTDFKNPFIPVPYKWNEDFLKNRYDIKVMRYSGDELDNESYSYDNTFYKNNQNQEASDPTRKFPAAGAVNFVDQEQNPNLLCGIAFGRNDVEGHSNPLDTNKIYCNAIAIKNGKSWNDNIKIRPISAVHSPEGYYELTRNSDGSENIEPTGENTIRLEHAPYPNRARASNDYLTGSGSVCQIVWLEAGEKITVASSSYVGKSRNYLNGRESDIWGWVYQDITFNLSLEPFRTNQGWIKVNLENTGTGTMDWNDDKTFLSDQLDLVKFLPSEEKVNDWIENFCKAFNLNLIQAAPDVFELNTKQVRTLTTDNVIDIDPKTGIGTRNNSLNLPSVYEVGFKIDKNEQGYVGSMTDPDDINSGEDGGGRFFTGSPENKTLSQSANFSYNWYVPFTNTLTNKPMWLPVISDKEAWEDVVIDYEEMQDKYYKNLAQRFWYREDGVLVNTKMDSNDLLSLGMAKGSIGGNQSMQLDYKVGNNSILDCYFTLLTDADNCYTTVECFLTPDEYNRMPESLIRFNGDLYYVADIDGYDPLCKKKATLKLIRKML